MEQVGGKGHQGQWQRSVGKGLKRRSVHETSQVPRKFTTLTVARKQRRYTLDGRQKNGEAHPKATQKGTQKGEFRHSPRLIVFPFASPPHQGTSSGLLWWRLTPKRKKDTKEAPLEQGVRTHTHTHHKKHSQTRAAHTHTHSNSLSLSLSLSLSPLLTRAHARTPTPTHTHTHVCPRLILQRTTATDFGLAGLLDF